jgi:vacuolar-type H+-ATPase subunit B/Vma2
MPYSRSVPANLVAPDGSIELDRALGQEQAQSEVRQKCLTFVGASSYEAGSTEKTEHRQAGRAVHRKALADYDSTATAAELPTQRDAEILSSPDQKMLTMKKKTQQKKRRGGVGSRQVLRQPAKSGCEETPRAKVSAATST